LSAVARSLIPRRRIGGSLGTAGRSRHHRTRSTRPSGPDDVFGPGLTTALRLVARRARRQRRRAWGIGLALPRNPIGGRDAWGQTSPLATARSAGCRLWRHFRLCPANFRYVSARLVGRRSGTQTMTIGELAAGAGRGASDLLFVKLDRSISAGNRLGRALHRGAQGLARPDRSIRRPVELGGFHLPLAAAKAVSR